MAWKIRVAQPEGQARAPSKAKRTRLLAQHVLHQCTQRVAAQQAPRVRGGCHASGQRLGGGGRRARRSGAALSHRPRLNGRGGACEGAERQIRGAEACAAQRSLLPRGGRLDCATQAAGPQVRRCRRSAAGLEFRRDAPGLPSRPRGHGSGSPSGRRNARAGLAYLAVPVRAHPPAPPPQPGRGATMSRGVRSARKMKAFVKERVAAIATEDEWEAALQRSGDRLLVIEFAAVRGTALAVPRRRRG